MTPITFDLELTRQEIFDAVAKHLAAQKRQSSAPDHTSTNGVRQCRYLHPEGYRCAIGIFIERPRPEYGGRKVALFIVTL
jgi:hypothetical protein